jgi:hypothetical protein
MLYFSDCELSLLARINAVWNIMMVNKTFHKSNNDSFGRDGKSTPRVSVHPNNGKHCPFCDESGSM